MLEFRLWIKSTMTEQEWDMVYEANKGELTRVMTLCQCDAITAGEKIVDMLEADTTQDPLLVATRMALFVLVAAEMMGPDFINSLTE